MRVLSVRNGEVQLTAQDEILNIVAGGEAVSLPDIDNIQNVEITSPADNDLLAYDTASQKFINQSASEAGIATSGGLATVATTGDYADLTNKPTLNRTSGHASTALPTGTTGDIIHITDNANKPAYYNGTAWKYFSDDTDV